MTLGTIILWIIVFWLLVIIGLILLIR